MYRCLQCKGSLNQDLLCSACGNRYDTHDGVRRFTNTDFYWGVSTKEVAQAFIGAAKQGGFYEALQKPEFAVFKKYAVGLERSDFHFMLPLQKDATILDLGSGYGNITVSLAQYYKRVVAADSTLELLQFSQERARAEGASNVEYVQIDPIDYCRLPFQEKSFDAIVMNGVLEWVGSADMTKDPGVIQQEVVQYLRTLLKDDGVLYVGIENRLYPLYVYNIVDPHSRIMYTSLLPRFVAHAWARFKGLTNGYRTYIYTLWGYKRLFKRAGFAKTELLHAFWSYREPSYVFGAEFGEVKRYFSENFLVKVFPRRLYLLYKLLFALRLEKVFAHSFLLISGGKDMLNIPSAVRIAEEAGCTHVTPKDILLKIASKDDYCQFLVFKPGNTRPTYLLKIPRNKNRTAHNATTGTPIFNNNNVLVYNA